MKKYLLPTAWNRIILSGITLAFVLFSCKKLEELFTFTVSDQSSFTINSSSPVNLPFTVTTPDVTTNSSQEFQNNNTNVQYIKDIKLKELKLTITNPSGQNFDFLKSVHIYISTNSSNEIELAYLDQIPAGAASLSLNTTNSKLDEYIKASSYSLRTSAVTKQILTQDVTVQVNSKFNVTARL